MISVQQHLLHKETNKRALPFCACVTDTKTHAIEKRARRFKKWEGAKKNLKSARWIKNDFILFTIVYYIMRYKMLQVILTYHAVQFRGVALTNGRWVDRPLGRAGTCRP